MCIFNLKMCILVKQNTTTAKRFDCTSFILLHPAKAVVKNCRWFCDSVTWWGAALTGGWSSCSLWWCQCQTPERLWQPLRVFYVCFLFLSVSDTEIQPFYLPNYFKCAGDKNSVFMYPGLSHGCFCASVGKGNKSSCFFNCYHNFKWISFELCQMERKELLFLLLQKRLWPSW